MSTPTPPAHGPGTLPPPPAGYAYPPPYAYVAVPPPVPAPPPRAPAGQPLAEFVDRLVARIIDVAILGAATAVVVIPIYVMALVALVDDLNASVTTIVDEEPFGGSAQLEGGELLAFLLPLLGVLALLIVLSLVFAYLYEVEMMFRSGQTIGKRTMKIQVIPIDPAQSLTRGLAARRFLIQHVAVAFVPLLNWIDGLWQLWDKPYRQCLHDKFATTVVIKLGP